MFVVIVFFEAKQAHVAEFHAAIVENARASVMDEPGCRQFDVAQDPNDPASFFLYEVYDDAEAFAAHKASGHFKHFDALSAPWTASKKVLTFNRITAPQKA
ncbi:MAG: antibiotic biosynthesis monooxygenase [Hyphomicrobiaceae bacterium]|nr:antibiotic biosynthesis monooxygenase [Hyphomicrobiaceae bacterium]